MVQLRVEGGGGGEAAADGGRQLIEAHRQLDCALPKSAISSLAA